MSALVQPFQSAPIDSRLSDLVQRAYEFVPFYRMHWRGKVPSRIASTGEFATLPIVRKVDLLAVPVSERLDRRYAGKRLSQESTSGSTGQPFTMYFSRWAWIRRRVRFVRGLLACGYRPGQRLMLISSRHSAGFMRVARWHYADLELGEHALCAKYQQLKPHSLYGPLSSLLLLAQQLANMPRPHKPKLVISTAEQLTIAHQHLLESAFQAPVADFYGSTELGLVAWRAPNATEYTFLERDFHLEFQPMSNHSDVERLIVTDLHPGPMPLIRFDTGDLVQRDDSTNRSIREIAGREVDCLQLPDGGKISPYQITMALERLGSLERYEVIQRADRNIDVFFWTQHGEPESISRSVEEVIGEQCGHQVEVAAHHSTEPIALTGRKIRPVRSEARKI